MFRVSGRLWWMVKGWDSRVERFWADANDADEDDMLISMETLVGERPADDAAAVYEWAAVHDFLGRESAAIPLYRKSLDLGLR